MKSIAYTLVNIPYLPVAKSLVDSFRKYNPDTEIYICLFDNKENINDDSFEDYNIIDVSILNKDDYAAMRNRYDNMSMACALKPFFAEALIQEYHPEILIYLDADIMIYDSLHEVDKVFQTTGKSIILTGHLNNIISDAEELSRNQEIRKYGLYNAGFYAIKVSKDSLIFLNWWKRFLFEKCILDMWNGIYYDQTWLDLAPVYFRHSLVLMEDLGYNVAYWNLNERDITSVDGKYKVNGTTNLVFYHFARYKFYTPELLDGYQMGFENHPTVKNIFEEYRAALKGNGYEKYIPKPSPPKRPTFREKVKGSLKYRINKLIDLI